MAWGCQAGLNYVGRQVDGATPQPVQKMTFEGLLRFVAKQKRLAGEVYTIDWNLLLQGKK